MNQPQGTLGAARNKGQGEDRLSAGILAAGLVATAAIGAPFQFVLPETIKAVVAVLFALGALTAFVWRPGHGAALYWSPFLAVPFGLALAALFSTAWAPASSAITEAIRWAVIGVIMLVAANVFRTVEFARVARSAHYAALFVCVLALLEFWLDFTLFPAIAAPGATFGNRNFLAEFIATALPFSFWLLLRETSIKRAIAWGASLGIILLALLATGTRSALIATSILAALTLLFVVFYRFRGGLNGQSLRNCLSGLAVALAVVAALGWVPSKSTNIIMENLAASRGLTPFERSMMRFGSLFKDSTYVEASSFGIRRAAWAAGQKMIRAHPLVGVGAGAWNTTVPLYLPETIETEHVWLAHNEPLQLIVEYGIAGWAGLLAVALLVLAAMAAALRMLIRKADLDRAPDLWAAALSVVMFGIVGLSGLPLHAASTCYIFALCLGLLAAGRPAGRIEFSSAKARPWLATGRVVALVALAVATIVSIQGMRADMLVQSASKTIHALRQDKSLPRETADNLRLGAVDQLRRGLEIYSDQGYGTVVLADSLASLQDPKGVIWLSKLMLETRPHVVALKCNLVRAHSDLGDFAVAGTELDLIRKTRPLAPCLALSEFQYAFKQGRFADASSLGQKLIGELNESTDPDVARYVVDMSYRAAIRVPAVDVAVDILRIRAERWPELRAASWLLAAQLLASRVPPDQASPAAVDAFRHSLAAASNQERPSVMSKIPDIYRRKLE